MTSNVLDLIGSLRLIPVVVAPDSAAAGDLADALVSGGLPIAEVTFRTDAAEAMITAMSADARMCVGAGTVTTVDQVDRAAAAGAQFVVTPGLSHAVVKRCQDTGLPILPGVATATDIMSAVALGVDVVKLFPAEVLGGVALISAFAGPFPSVRFVPTGGVGPSQAERYLAHRSVLAVGGSWMVAADLLAAHDWEAVAERTRQAVDRVSTVGRAS